ncbi:hypothetical protein EUX98_g1504 [Antrodiella citrinella]|uniref:ENTH domain-containing protein n=1 Tax=Antrodiella citrinella TaxID=2447956 RepID=A0A4S4N197_9APHY|nr:hypothetical protein EUX98_g1504 [Antrodiella citrinella]
MAAQPLYRHCESSGLANHAVILSAYLHHTSDRQASIYDSADVFVNVQNQVVAVLKPTERLGPLNRPVLECCPMSTMQHFGKGIVRVAKNYTKGYSDVQAKVRDATSNDPWGPSGTQMNELAQMTYNQNDFVEIMEMLDKRLNDKGKNWRHVFKSLTVLDYLLHAGSENVVIYFKDNLYVIKTLKEFQFVDEYGKDQGANVRQKAKDISNLLTDESRLRQERRSRAHMRDRMVGQEGEDEDVNENELRRSRSAPPKRTTGNADEELRRAIEESKRSLAVEQAKQGHMTAEERDLAEAIKLSEEEEKKRSKQLEDLNQSALFDDQNQLINLNGNSNNPFPLDAQYTQQLQPQMTAMPTQYTSFNPYQQQAQQEAMQAEYARQQQDWARQQQDVQMQQQVQLQQQAQLQAQQQQEEWMRQQQLQQQMLQFQQQQQPLVGQPTGFGSNNPFALSASPQPMPSYSSSPGPQASAPVSFNLQGTYSNGNLPTQSFSPPPAPKSAPPGSGSQRQPTRADQSHAQLADLFANRDEDGIDSFGNFGQLRYGQQAGRLVGQATGPSSHNPFSQQQQQQGGSEQPFFSI